jgi:hypothetical protein
MEGVIPYSGGYGSGTAMIGNPSSLSILGTPASLLESVNQLLSKNPNIDLGPIGQLAPAYSAALAAASFGKLTTTAHPSQQSVAKSVLDELVGALPEKRFWRAITGQPPYQGSVYGQQSPLDALISYGIMGNLWKRPLDVNMANYKAWKLENPPKYVGG